MTQQNDAGALPQPPLKACLKNPPKGMIPFGNLNRKKPRNRLPQIKASGSLAFYFSNRGTDAFILPSYI